VSVCIVTKWGVETVRRHAVRFGSGFERLAVWFDSTVNSCNLVW
jgi:hypothetical protein